MAKLIGKVATKIECKQDNLPRYAEQVFDAKTEGTRAKRVAAIVKALQKR